MPLGLISGEKTLEAFNRPLIPVLIFFASGIITGRVFLPYIQWLYLPIIILAISILVISLILRRVLFRLISFLIVFFLIGASFEFATAIQPKKILELAKGKKNIVLEGVVLSPEEITGERSRFDFLVEEIFPDQDSIPLREKVKVTIYDNIVTFDPGQRIRFPASLSPFKNFNNPGRYDYEGNMSLRGFSCRASVSDGRYIVPMGKGSQGLLMNLMESVRRPIRKFMINSLSPRNASVYRALILGEMQGIDNNLRESFNITGLGHVLSVSGLHVGLVAVVSFALFRFLFARSCNLMLKTDIRKLTALITCLCVFFYTFIAGFQVSAKRAMIMAITYLLSIVLDREKDPWSTLALAALIVLALDPNDLFNISFQLSFIAVIGIFWLSPEIYRAIKKTFDNLQRGRLLSRLYIYFSSILVITLSAVIFLLPVTTYYFYRISIAAVPINLIVEPLLGLWILPVGLLSIVFLPVSGAVSTLILKAGSCGLDCMMNIIEYWSGFNWASFWSITPNPFEISLCYGMIFFLIFSIKRRRWAKMGLLVIVIIGIIDVSYWVYETRVNQGLRVTFIDVGQGSSALVQLPGRERILIDGGGFLNSTFDTGRMIVAPFLLHSKIRRIDYVVLSHPHPDHLKGLVFIAENFSPGEFWYNGQDLKTTEFTGLMETFKRKNVRILGPNDLSQGREIAGVKIEFFNPSLVDQSGAKGVTKEDSASNNESLVLKIACKGRSFLFPGDIEEKAEKRIVSNIGAGLKSDILLVPHHGSRSSSTEAFINAVSPEISVISCGKDNAFKFPSGQTLQRLKDIGSKIIRIDESGAVRITINNEGMQVDKFIR